MNEKFLKVEDIMEILGISKSAAYKLMRELNEEMVKNDVSFSWVLMSLDDLISAAFVMYFSLDVFSASVIDSYAFMYIFSMILSCMVLLLVVVWI